MKKIKFVFISLAFSFLMQSNNVYSQKEVDHQSNFNIGIGIDLKFPDLDQTPFPPTDLILPIDIYNILRIEPGFGFSYREEFEVNSLDEKNKQFRYSLGIYWLKNFNKSAMYLGVHIDNVKTRNEYFLIAPPSKYTQDEFRIGPLVGLEYRFVDKLSVGGELLVLRVTTKSHFTNSNNTVPRNTKGWKTANSIKLRFYF